MRFITIVLFIACCSVSISHAGSNDIIDSMYEKARVIEFSTNKIDAIRKAAVFYKWLDSLDTRDANCIYHVEHVTMISRDSAEIAMIKDYLSRTKDKTEKQICLFILTKSCLLTGDANATIEYYNSLASDYPQSGFLAKLSTSDLDVAHIASRRLDSLNMRSMSLDEKEWLRGNIFFDACCVSWNMQEVSCNMSYPFAIFNNLINCYPDSRYAGEAAFKMIFFDCVNSHEGGDFHMGCVPDYEKYILTYPRSVHVVDAKWAIAEHMYNYWKEKISDRLEYVPYNEKRCTLEKLLARYRWLADSSNSKYSQSAKEMTKDVNDLLQKCALSLQIENTSSYYVIGDKVRVKFKLVNMTNTNQLILLNAENEPSFCISINLVNRFGDKQPIQYSITKDFYHLSKKRTIQSNGLYQEVVDINRKIGAVNVPYFTGNVCRYDLVPGTYEVTGYYCDQHRDTIIPSNPIKVTIIDRQ